MGKSDLSARIPTHVALIMDGNGRWAKKRGLPRLAGHRAGTENLRRVIRYAYTSGIKYLTFYAFSTENWSRPEDEVRGLMTLLSEFIDRETDELHKEGVRLLHIGHLEALPPELRKKVQYAIDLTKENDNITVILAFNYGGRDEIITAIQRIISTNITPDQVSEQLLSDSLFTAGIPDPDLVIRTSGEQRTSNFLVWQSVYSEWMFPNVLWPDFDEKTFNQMITDYGKRERRFGGLTSDSGSKVT